MDDRPEKIVEAVLRLQDALRNAGLSKGAVDVRLGDVDMGRLRAIVVARPDLVPDPDVGGGYGRVEIAGVKFA